MALNFQKNIFLEKPGVIKKSELKQLGNLGSIIKCKLMIGYVYCYNDYIKYIKKILNRKLLGTSFVYKFTTTKFRTNKK